MELKMRNLNLRIKCSFSKMNSEFSCFVFFYSTFISTLLKVALKNFKRMLLLHRFDGFFRFIKLFFKSVSSKLVEELEGTTWTVLKKGRGVDPLDPSPHPPTLLMRTSKDIFRTESNIYEAAFFAKIGNSYKPLAIFTNKLHRRYAAVKVTLDLTFLRKTKFKESWWNYIRLYLKKNKIFSVCVWKISL